MRINLSASQRLSSVKRATQWMFLGAVALVLLTALAATSKKLEHKLAARNPVQDSVGVTPIQLAKSSINLTDLSKHGPGVLHPTGETRDLRLNPKMNFHVQEPAVDVFRITQGF